MKWLLKLHPLVKQPRGLLIRGWHYRVHSAGFAWICCIFHSFTHFFTQESAEVPPGGRFLRSFWWGRDGRSPTLLILFPTFEPCWSTHINSHLKRVETLWMPGIPKECALLSEEARAWSRHGRGRQRHVVPSGRITSCPVMVWALVPVVSGRASKLETVLRLLERLPILAGSGHLTWDHLRSSEIIISSSEIIWWHVTNFVESDDSELFQHVSTCFNMFQHVSTCFNMFQAISTRCDWSSAARNAGMLGRCPGDACAEGRWGDLRPCWSRVQRRKVGKRWETKTFYYHVHSMMYSS